MFNVCDAPMMRSCDMAASLTATCGGVENGTDGVAIRKARHNNE